MRRAYLVYFLMFAALIGGMLMIWSLGDNVRAPDDLSGDWVIEWDNAPPPESGEPKMRVAQSGRFFVITFGQRPPMSMKLDEDWTGKNRGRTLDMRLARPPWALRLHGPIPAGASERWRVPELNLELVGPTRHVGIARRVIPATAENSEEPAPVPARPAPADAREPAKAAMDLPSTNPTAAAPTASVPSAETAHAR
jgi:hypothetical protein